MCIYKRYLPFFVFTATWLCTSNEVVVAQPSLTRNFISTIELKQPGVKTSLAVNAVAPQSRITKVEYLDGLGRSEQTVLVNAKELGTDIVLPKQYDQLGRNEKEFLAYAVPMTGTGAFRPGWQSEQQVFYQNNNPASLPNDLPDAHPYGRTIFESSPLNRPLKNFAPGNAWAGTAGSPTEVAVRTEFRIYDASAPDHVRSWELDHSTVPAQPVISGYTYQAGDLVKTITYDEHGKQTAEYKDRKGNVILKKVQLANNLTSDPHLGWLCTYYIYDNLNRLRFVLPPRATEFLRMHAWALTPEVIHELCFWYDYDETGRLITKHVPGAQPENMVYDKRDRLVFSQDGNMKAEGKWLFTLFDHYNRPVATAFWYYSDDRESLQAMVDQDAMVWTIVEPVLGDDLVLSCKPTFVDVGKLDVLTVNLYDNYKHSVGENPGAVFYTGYSLPYTAGQATVAGDYPSVIERNITVEGKLTATKAKILDPGVVLNGNEYLYAINYYDREYRVLQSIKQTLMGVPYVFDYITNVVTNQFDFTGKQLASQEVVDQYGMKWSVITKNELDIEGKVTKIFKKISSLFHSSNEKLIVTNEYDQLGRLKKKTTGTGTISENILDYTYNIRGWLRGVNMNYLAGNIKPNNQRFFGFEIGYNTLTSGGTLPNPQLNGNIGSMSWASAGRAGRDDLGIWTPSPNGAGIQRKYDYTYDNTNRIKKADFTELKYSNWINTEKDFSISGDDNGMIRYDENGNIQSMDQSGVKGTTVQLIDKLQYSYFNNGYSNRLMAVHDVMNDQLTDLGDFKELKVLGNTQQDYYYDGNGNMIKDLNKHIEALGYNPDAPAINYNYLNLPHTISVLNSRATTEKGIIKFSFDALGNRYRKTVTDYSTTPHATVTITNYVNGFVFGGGFGTSLDQVATEEGRIRYAIQPNNTIDYEYDWFVKDHLGNIRMVLTEQPTPSPTFQYRAAFEDIPTSTVSGADIEKERELFGEDVLQPSRSLLPIELRDKNEGNKKCALIKPGNNNGKVPYKILKVQPGDKFTIGVQYYYRAFPKNNNGKALSQRILTDLISGILGVGIKPGEGKDNLATGATSGISSSYRAVPDMLSNDREQQAAARRPRAFLNYVMTDSLLQVLDGGALQVGEVDAKELEWKQLVKHDIQIAKPGYFLVYLSNEEQPASDPQAGHVYFDNLVVVTNEGPVLEENHYYPFGLLIHPLSTTGGGRLKNRNKYNGKEFQNNEFADGSGLEWYDFGSRMEDPQIGRWHAVDNESETYFALSPYHYGGNSPVNTIDIDGNLFIFANGFMWKHYMGGQNRTNRIPMRLVGEGRQAGWVTVPNANYYAPDRGFFKDGPRNNGVPFKSDYWEGIDLAYIKKYKDKNAYYTNGSFTPLASANARFKEGELAGQQLIKKLESGDIVLKKDETIKIVGHSQGAAYAAGIASALSKDSKYGSMIEFIDYISPHQPGDFQHPTGVYGRQFSTRSDKVSSKSLVSATFGESSFSRIMGINFMYDRDYYKGGMGGHYINTWKNDLLSFWGEQK